MSRLNTIQYALVAVLVLLSAGGVHALSCELQQTSTVDNGRIEIEVSIDLQTLDNQKVKAVNVKEYIPRGLFKNTYNGVFTGFGLMWNLGIIEKSKTTSYTLRIPEISETTTYELKTVVEYQNHDDMMTLEKTTYLTVSPEGQVWIDNEGDVKSVKADDKGYSKVYWRRPDFKAYSVKASDNTNDVGTVVNDNNEDSQEDEEWEVEEEAPAEEEVAEDSDDETEEVAEDSDDKGKKDKGKKDKGKGKKDKGKKDKDKGKGKDK